MCPSLSYLWTEPGFVSHRYVPGLTSIEVQTVEDVVDALRRAKENRAVTATKMNSESSRGHSLVTIEVRDRPKTYRMFRSFFGIAHPPVSLVQVLCSGYFGVNYARGPT